MPRLIPARPDPGAPDGERFVLDALAAGLPPDAVVYHRCRYARARADGRPPGEGELDALAVVPGRGCLVLEIKSGGVRHGPEGWASVDRHGVAHPIRDPADQAAGAARWLRKFGRERGVWKRDADLPPIEWAVAFPDLAVRASLAPALPRERTLDRDDLRALPAALDRLLPEGKMGTGSLFHATSRPGAPVTEKGACPHFPGTASAEKGACPHFPGLDQIHLARLERELAPALDLVVPLATWIAADERTLVRLTEEQGRILACLGGNRRVAVCGGAGTGKTVLAREVARRLAAGGERVLVLCYNRLLADLLADLLARDAAEAEIPNLTVATFHGLAEELARAAGLPWAPPAGDPGQTFWRETANELLFDALARCPERRFDAVVVDEAQDFADAWWVTVEALLADPAAGRLWLFHDPAQAIFGGAVPERELRCATFELPWNCRNTRRIAERAWRHLGPAEGAGDGPRLHADAPEGEPPAEVVCRDDHGMVKEVARALHRILHEAKIPAARTLVLTPFNLDKSAVWKNRHKIPVPLVRLEPGAAPPAASVPPNAVPMASLARFKGLEADAVVLCEIRPASHACTPRHLYVGASRARHLLVEVRYAEE